MTPAQLQKVEEIFHSALDCDPAELQAFLDKACAGDKFLRSKVESLLTSYQNSTDFIEQPPTALAARIIQTESQCVDVLIGHTIGHYKIIEHIGTGGMGEVYLATDTKAERKAALKLLPSRFTGDAERLKRFQQEARAVIALNHPNILTIYEIGEEDSTYYIVSELIEGETLRQRLSRQPLALKDALDLTIQVASALAAAHEAGIVHRDIKPENIMLRRDGYVKVLDFGIAKLAEQELPSKIDMQEAIALVATNVGSILGTVRYMSPEQARGEPVDGRTDIWSLGVVLYEIVAGGTPFFGATPNEIINSTLTSEPAPIVNAPAQLQQIIAKALRKDRQERFGTINEMLEALKDLQRKLEFRAELERAPVWLRWIRTPRAATLALLAIAIVIALPLFWIRNETTARTMRGSKTIAVLPFENLSDDKTNAFFAQGIQDEILTALSRISGLKVVSRTSTAGLTSRPKNLRDVARELGVANILEGSVQKSGDHIHINVQLINAASDRHLWAQSYDRPITDIFSVEGEVAKSVADALRTTLTPEEKTRVETKPTTNASAYALYLRAVEILHRATFSKEEHLTAVTLLEQAVALDPDFALARARLSFAYANVYHFDEATDARRDQAVAQAKEALLLQPNLGEGHLALAYCHYWGWQNYAAAMAEVAIAQKYLPNDPEIFAIQGAIARRQGRWKEAVEDFKHALALDPLNIEAAHTLEQILFQLRDWPAAIKANREMLAVLQRQPSSDLVINEKIEGAYLVFFQTGNLQPLQAALEQCPPGVDPDGGVTTARFDLAILERDFAAAERAINECKLDSIPTPLAPTSKQDLWAALRRARGESVEAIKPMIEMTTRNLEQEAAAHPEDGTRHALLGLQYAAYTGRKADAIREGRRAVELAPLETNPTGGTGMLAALALIYTQTGEPDQAIPLIEKLLTTPGPVLESIVSITLAELRLRPDWDPLRKDSRFQKILAGPEPKTVYQ